MVKAGWEANDHGGGIAWREEGDDQHVYFSKGLTLEEMIIHCAEKPLPYIAHFRIASCGGRSPELTHPFPITPEVSLDLEGRAPAVLFHNGHWGNWKNVLVDMALKTGYELPANEPWSDSRVMAFAAARVGLGFLSLIEERIAVLTPKSFYVLGTGWKTINGIHCSNDSFDRYIFKHGGNSIVRGRGEGHQSFTTPPASMGGGSDGTRGAVSERPTLLLPEHTCQGTTSLHGRNIGGSTNERKGDEPPFVSGTVNACTATSIVTSAIPLSKKALKRLRRQAEDAQARRLRVKAEEELSRIMNSVH